jgi:ABC-type sugar transport system ATPase subunit
MSSLEIHNLSKRLGDNLVVDDVSLRVAEGEFFVLLGASGGGKSTLLRLICGLETPDSGEVWLAGRNLTGLPPRARNIGMVFQDYGLYPAMNVFENIAYGLEARRLPRAEIETRVTEAATKLGLTALLRRSIVDLSGGEQQRVALARALARDADLYLFDEPLSNLDPKLRVGARRDILTLHRQKGRPSLYVTHDQTEAFAIADRIGIMAAGRLQQVGDTETLINRPANTLVARFLGTPPMNLIPARLEQTADGLLAVADGFRLPLSSQWPGALTQHRPAQVLLGLRPEVIGLAHNGADEAGTVITPAQVIDVEALVSETIVRLRLGEHTELAVLWQDAAAEEFNEGDMVAIALNPTTVCLFDAESGQAL